MHFSKTLIMAVATLATSAVASYDTSYGNLEARDYDDVYDLKARDADYELINDLAARDIDDLTDLFTRAIEIRTDKQPNLAAGLKLSLEKCGVEGMKILSLN